MFHHRLPLSFAIPCALSFYLPFSRASSRSLTLPRVPSRFLALPPVHSRSPMFPHVPSRSLTPSLTPSRSLTSPRISSRCIAVSNKFSLNSKFRAQYQLRSLSLFGMFYSQDSFIRFYIQGLNLDFELNRKYAVNFMS